MTDPLATLQRIATRFLVLSPYARAGEVNRIIRCNLLHVLQALARQCHRQMHGIALRAPFEVERKGRQHDPGLLIAGCLHLTVSAGLPAPSQEGDIVLPGLSGPSRRPVVLELLFANHQS